MFEVSLDDHTKRKISFLQTLRSICVIHRTSDQIKLNNDVSMYLGKYTQQNQLCKRKPYLVYHGKT